MNCLDSFRPILVGCVAEIVSHFANPFLGGIKTGTYTIICRALFGGGLEANGYIQFLIATPEPDVEQINLNYTITRNDWNVEFDNGTDAFSGDAFPSGDLQTLVLVVDSGVAYLYRSGELKASRDLVGNPIFDPASRLTLTVDSNGENVSITEATVLDRALSAEEVAALG